MRNWRLYLGLRTYQFRQVVSISCSVKSIGNVINVDQLTVKSIYNLCINFIIKRLAKKLPRNRRYDRDRDGRQRERERDTEGKLSQVLNVAMANDALKPKTKQLPKSFRKDRGRSREGGEGRGTVRSPGWLPGRLADLPAG